MNKLSNILINSASPELKQFVSLCQSNGALLQKLEGDPSKLIPILGNMDVEINKYLAFRLLVKVNPKDFENSTVRKVETALRNKGLLNRGIEPDIEIKDGEFSFQAHKAILALESSYFMSSKGFKEYEQERFDMQLEGIDPQVYQLAVDYLYLSDEERKIFVSKVDEEMLAQLAQVSEMWRLEALRKDCDEKLCNLIGELIIEEDEVEEWLEYSKFLPKFTKLLSFIQKEAKEGAIKPIIKKIQTWEGAYELAAKCEPEEILAFRTLDTEFGWACQPPERAFGKKEIEEAFPVTVEVPSPPSNFRAILEQVDDKDDHEPKRKLKETCILFYCPETVTLHDEEGDRELLLDMEGMEELAKRANNPEYRSKYYNRHGFDDFKNEMNQQLLPKSEWVLLRKVFRDTRGKTFGEQIKQVELLKDSNFRVPNLLNAIWANFLLRASTGEYFHGTDHPCWTYTRCAEKRENYQTAVGGFDSSGLHVHSYYYAFVSNGLSGSWKF